jgi:nucleoredoxin
MKPKSFKEMVGASIYDKAGDATFEKVAGSAEVICMYFSAHWCGPCRSFTPQLITAYNAMIAKKCPIQIFFCSFDHSEKDYKEYFGSMPWASLGFKNPIAESLGNDFGVEGIPALLVFDKNGNLLTKEGRGDIGSSKAEAFNKWKALIH